MSMRGLAIIALSLFLTAFAISGAYCQDDDTARNVLKQGLLGAGTGAIASGASGGNAGTGALIGAGTGVIGGILLDAITSPPRSSRRSNPPPQDDYYDAGQSDEYYEEPPQESGTQKVLKQGLLGAGTGAIASGASGGNAGTGALIGAGTGVIGGALLDTITQPSQPRRVYRRPKPAPMPQAQAQRQNIQVQEEQTGSEGSKKKIIKHYDASGKLVSEEEVYY
ncbi:MAG: glycine zipper family protein [Candidatus Omnitrophota bacterium]|nr:glycine zipper family protein [Candidatus Omnitrophota bacterium]